MFRSITFRLIGLASMISLLSCEKLLEIKDPTDSLTTQKVFNNDKQAIGAMVGVYTLMIKMGAFSATTVNSYGMRSSDEKNMMLNPTDNFYRNALTAFDNNTEIWNSAYFAVYGSNSIIEGIAASTAPGLTEPIRKLLTAEAKFTRAFAYFYLINFYGDVPLLLTSNLEKNKNKKQTAVAEIYTQIIKDLDEAIPDLPTEYPKIGQEESRIRPCRWAAKAFLARVYLYTQQYTKAIAEANDVLAQTAILKLEESDINKVFLKNSPETIWELQPDPSDNTWGNAVPEAAILLPNPLKTGSTDDLSGSLLNAFEPGDIRRTHWIDSTRFSSGNQEIIAHFPYKYKAGLHNKVVGMDGPEYHVVFRLAEVYLIRAEACILNNEIEKGMTDLNKIRQRAHIPALPTTMAQQTAITAIAEERQTELFCEWGHRWLDLKRTQKAEAVLSLIPAKQPWRGNYQLLYPIPQEELRRNPFLQQNPGY